MLSLSSVDITMLTFVTLVLVLFILIFFKEIRLVLLSRHLARVSGVPERVLYYATLFLAGAVVSSNLTTVGGLLIFALLVQPGATALQLTYNLKYFFIISLASGVGACLIGLAISYIFDLPSGAAVVLVATTIFSGAYHFSPKRRTIKPKERILTHDENDNR